MKENCKNLKYVKIPTIYPEATKLFPNIIMMEYIQGEHISKIDATDYETYAKLIIKYGFVSLLITGITHGDLHGGNIIFIKNAANADVSFQIGIIDFGIVLKINPTIKNVFLEIFSELFTKPSIEIATELLNIIIEPKDVWSSIPKKHSENIIHVTANIIEHTIHSTKGVTQIKIYEFLEKFNNYVNDNNMNAYGLCIGDDFVKMQLALAMSHGLCLCLCKQNYLKVANDVLNTMFHTDLLQN
jgi:predicted unusual protein kinase regulating ubiquinone biosynthesis (AarF/ABC1/UbiB family)